MALADPTTIGASRFTHAGHSLVYLSGVCAETPVRARLCGPGEQGSIVTTYPDFRESQPYSWNMVPVSLYLQGSLAPEDRILYTSQLVKNALQDHARAGFLAPVCGPGLCPPLQHTYWRDVVGATAVRDVWVFAVRSTRAEDEAAVAWLNNDANRNRYNSFTHNCADFTRSFVNAILPNSVHRDVLNDIGLMSPKAAVRSFSHWAAKHPELGLYGMHFAQQPGSLPRGGLARSGTEAAIHTKKYLIPAALIGDHELAGSFFVAYFFTGRFGLYKNYARSARTLQGEAGGVGSADEWASYQERFSVLRAEGDAAALLPPKTIKFPESWSKADVTVDEQGGAWLQLGNAEVGLQSSNLMASTSDPQEAYRLMLLRVAYELHAKDRMRETIDEFRQDWQLLEAARKRFRAGRVVEAQEASQ